MCFVGPSFFQDRLDGHSFFFLDSGATIAAAASFSAIFFTVRYQIQLSVRATSQYDHAMQKQQQLLQIYSSF